MNRKHHNRSTARRASLEQLEHRRLLAASPAGAEFLVNTITTGQQDQPASAMDAVGNFVIVWESDVGISGQRFNPQGVPQGAEFMVNTGTTGGGAQPAVSMDVDGDFVVVWTNQLLDGDQLGVSGQRFDDAGVKQGGQFQVNTVTTAHQSSPSIGMDADGDFVVTWTSSAQDGGGYGIYAQRYNSAGVAQGGEFRVNTFTAGDQASSTVTMSAGGDFVAAWASRGQVVPGRDSIHFQRFDSSGAAQGAETLVYSSASASQILPFVAGNDSGAFVVTWSNVHGLGSEEGATARRYDALGNALGPQFRVNTFTTGSQSHTAAVVFDDGAFMITWSSGGQDGSAQGIYGQAYDASGAADGGEFRVNTYTTLDQFASTTARDDAGNFVIAWQSRNELPTLQVRAQRYAVAEQIPPVVVSSQLEYLTQQAVSITFDEPLNPATVSATDLGALNLDNAATPSASSVSLSAGNTVATWVFNTPGTFISDGDYTFTLAAGAVSDVAGNALAAQYQVTGAGIWFLGGDATRDRQVNLADYNILAGNYGQSPRNFAQGDFNYDNLVNLADYNILAARYGLVLAARQAPIASSADRGTRSLLSLLSGELD